jgi:hypothetical protein
VIAPIATRRDVERLVGNARQREEHGARRRRVLAVRARPSWTEAGELVVGGETVRVVACPSALGVRAALIERDDPEEWVVVLTDRDERDLGAEVVARLARGRIVTLDAWEAVAAAFGARAVDPALRTIPELAAALLEAAPLAGYPPAPGAIVERDEAWTALCRHALGLEELDGDADAAVLAWLGRGDHTRLAALPEPVVEGLFAWLDARATAAAGLARALRDQSRARDAVAVGLVCGCLVDQTQEKVARARGRLEGMVGFVLDDRRVATLASAAAGVADAEALARADALLAELDATALAASSDVITSGFTARLAELGRCLAGALAEPALIGQATSALERCRAHREAAESPQRVDAAAMALRLTRRHARDDELASSLGDAARRYADDGALIDLARAHVWRGESQPELTGAYEELDRRLHALRDAQNKRFAELLRDWLAAESTAAPLVPVEEVLASTVLPLVATTPALLIVLDACSLPAWHELAPGFAALGFDELVHQGDDGRRLGLATVPSLTRCSRTSLLSGDLRVGASADERRGFNAATAGVRATALFHKADLVPSAGGAVAQAVVDAIADSRRRLVAVVINELDDALSGGMQADRRLDVRAIAPLAACLEVARQAGRICVVTADHGHVVEYAGTQRSAPGAGERWRPAGGAPEPGEIELAGRRVLEGGGRVVVPWTERMRYSRTRAAGYHGGASLQEMVVPLVVLAPRGSVPAGWRIAAASLPEWWENAVETPLPAAARRAAEPIAIEAEAPAWLEPLLASARYRAQVERFRRTAPDDGRARRALTLLAARGGRVTVIAMARLLAQPPVRTRGLVNGLGRVLAIDGAAALRIIDDEVLLDIGLLREGFDV